MKPVTVMPGVVLQEHGMANLCCCCMLPDRRQPLMCVRMPRRREQACVRCTRNDGSRHAVMPPKAWLATRAAALRSVALEQRLWARTLPAVSGSAPLDQTRETLYRDLARGYRDRCLQVRFGPMLSANVLGLCCRGNVTQGLDTGSRDLGLV